MPEDKVNILVVDDLQDKLLAMQVMLEELNENVVTAQSGYEALRRLLDQEFAVILLDVNMPDMDGFETASLIRQRKRSAHTPIIFVTAYSDEILTVRGYSLGAVDYILAPVLPEILRTKVRVFVDLYRMAEQVKRQAEERIALERAQAARAAAEETAQRTAFLAQASKVLTSSLDYEATLGGLTHLLIPYLADLSIIALLGDQQELTQAQVAWHGSSNQPRVLTMSKLDRLPDGLTAGVRRMLGVRQLEHIPEVKDWFGIDWTMKGAAENDAKVSGPDFPLGSAVCLPLQARGRSLGVMTLALRPGREFKSADLPLLEDLAGRAAIALDNARLYRNIQDGDRLKNEFLAMLAHELRNPLAPIRNAVHILRCSDASGEQFQFAREIIDRQLEQMVRLVDDLLDVSRITRGKISLQREALDLRTVTARAVETSRPLIDARKQELTLALPEQPVPVKGDSTRLAQVVSNLLNNAAKFTPERGRIWLTLEVSDGDAVVRVRDSGVGISENMLSSIFDLFVQGDRSLDRSQGGLGIGLTLVRRLVEMHGGSVRAHSAGANQGSEFVVRLPTLLAPEKPAALKNGRAPSSQKEAGRRVLIVDDNVDAAETLALLLRQLGHDVCTAHNGATALELAGAHRPEVVLLDIGLPGMDGYEVARQLKEQPGMDSVRIAAVTGYGQESDRARSQAAGFQYHLVKPVDLQILEEVLA
jgi:signal transduction histidine kinase/DNA-binding response OmpR family regulator